MNDESLLESQLSWRFTANVFCYFNALENFQFESCIWRILVCI